MAAMSTALTVFATVGNTRTYTQSAHTVQAPLLVLQKRVVPTGNQVIAEDTLTVLSHTEDADGVTLPQRVTFSATVRRPITGDVADQTAMLAVFRDIVASDEFGTMVSGQKFVKA